MSINSDRIVSACRDFGCDGLCSMAPKVKDSSLSFWAERAVALLAIGGILFACFLIAKPLLLVLAWGGLIAIALAPLHRALARAGGNRPKARCAWAPVTCSSPAKLEFIESGSRQETRNKRTRKINYHCPLQIGIGPGGGAG